MRQFLTKKEQKGPSLPDEGKSSITMALREQLPQGILDLLQGSIESERDVLIATRTDIDRFGRNAVQWLAVTESELFVIVGGAEPAILNRLKKEQASEFRCQNVVGSGLLQAQTDGMYLDLLRFSNTLADKFHKVASKLHRWVQDQKIQIHEDDEIDPRRCKSCGLMLTFPGDVCPKCVNKGAVFGRMVTLLSSYKYLALLMMGLLLVGIALDLVVPQLTRFLVDNVLPTDRVVEQGGTPAIRSLLTIVAILAVVQILRAGVNVVNGRLGNRIGTSITFDVRGKLVEHLQKLSVSYYDQQQVGSLVGRVAYDTEALHGFVAQLTGGFLFQLIMVVGVGIMMFSINVKLAMFTLIPAPLVITGSILFWKYIYPRYYRFWDASSKQAGTLTGTLSGIRVVKAFNQEEHEVSRFNKVSSNLTGTRRNVDGATLTFNPIMALIFQFGGWIVWYVGGKDVLGVEMSLGSLMAYFGYLAMFYGPLTTLTQFTNWLTQFSTQAHRIFEIFDTPVEIADATKPVKLKAVKDSIRFENVTFGYNRNNPILNNLELTIRSGEMIGIVGRSGSGKTTVVNLLSRFYDVNEGRVLIDGVDVRDIDKGDLRNLIGVVLQEPFLFRGSVWQNLVYGKPDASVEEVIASAKAANAHGFIMQKPQGYDTWVGERGAGLSGGERQRTGIARVLLIDPKILILDEATSSVDPESEASIQAALAEVVKNRTTIAIAHRLSTLRHADRILVVDQGTVAEDGSHEELVEKDGLYARLVRIQGQMTMPSVDRLTVENDLEDPIPYKETSRLPHPRSHHTRWLAPDIVKVHEDEFATMHVDVENEGTYSAAYALRCLPVHYPRGYISLRMLTKKKREVEIGIIRDLEEWPEESRQTIEHSLLKRYLVHNVRSISSIVVNSNYLDMKIVTDEGPRDIMLRWQTDKAHDYGKNGKMLIDSEENRYLIPDVAALPEKDRKLFERHIYW